MIELEERPQVFCDLCNRMEINKTSCAANRERWETGDRKPTKKCLEIPACLSGEQQTVGSCERSEMVTKLKRKAAAAGEITHDSRHKHRTNKYTAKKMHCQHCSSDRHTILPKTLNET